MTIMRDYSPISSTVSTLCTTKFVVNNSIKRHLLEIQENTRAVRETKKDAANTHFCISRRLVVFPTLIAL